MNRPAPPTKSSHRVAPLPPPRADSAAARGQRTLLLVLILAVSGCVWFVHWPVLSARAFTFDDQQYLADNYLVQNPSWMSLQRFFGEVRKPSTVRGYYQPLAMTSLMLDYAMAGSPDNYRPFHRTSLILHVANTALIIVLLYTLFGQPWIAAGVGLLFGVHPMAVEPIAWLGERKTVLATLFALLCFILYVRYAQRPRRLLFVGALVAFILALLSKPTTTPIPALLLLLDYWPLRRLSWRHAFEKIPFFIIAGISALITIVSQARSGTVGLPQEYAPWRIPLTLCHNIIFYLYKIAWPLDLSPHYAMPDRFDFSQPMLLAGFIGTLILLPLLLLSLRWTRALLAGWLFFFVALLPTTGIIGFTIVIASDKYAYLPSVGLLLVAAYFLTRLWQSPALHASARRAGAVIVILALAACAGAATHRQIGYWQTTERLYRHMLVLTPDSYAPHADLGLEYARQGKPEAAIAEFRRALQLRPRSIEVLSNLAKQLALIGQDDDAVAQFHEALRIDPNSYLAHWNLAAELGKLGRPADAVEHYQAALHANPNAYMAYDEMALELAKLGRLDEAVAALKAALRINPNACIVHHDLGSILAQQGKPAEAGAQFQAALHDSPNPVPTLVAWGMLLATQGQFEEAITRLTEAVRLAPDYAEAQVNLGVCLFKLGKNTEAAAQFREVIRRFPDLPRAYLDLGGVLEAQGQTDAAAAVYADGLRRLPGNPELQARVHPTTTSTSVPVPP